VSSDRELLEKAARAAGLELTADNFIAPGEIPALTEEWGLCTGLGPTFWNPLTNDGDALRLAVKLGIGLWQYMLTGEVEAELHTPAQGSFTEWRDPDPCAATRRAIVRAAAALGEQHDQ